MGCYQSFPLLKSTFVKIKKMTWQPSTATMAKAKQVISLFNTIPFVPAATRLWCLCDLMWCSQNAILKKAIVSNGLVSWWPLGKEH